MRRQAFIGVLWALLGLILAVSRAPADAMAQSVCNEAEQCWSLFALGDSLDLLSLAPPAGTPQAFRNPMLQAEVGIREGQTDIQPGDTIRLQLTDPVEIANDDISELMGGEADPTCNLVLVGLSEGSTDFVLRSEISVVTDATLKPLNSINYVTATVYVHAFCQNNNLPVTATALNRNPPPGETLYDREQTSDDLRADSAADSERMGAIVARLVDGTCPAAPNADPLAVTDLSAQMAVFVHYENPDVPPDMARAWDTFVNTEQNRLYLRDYAGIHCLLGQDVAPLTVDFTCTPTCTGIHVAPHDFDVESATSGDIISTSFTIQLEPDSDAVSATTTEEIDVYTGALPDAEPLSQSISIPGTYTLTLCAQVTPSTFINGEVASRVSESCTNQSFELRAANQLPPGALPPPPIDRIPAVAVPFIGALSLRSIAIWTSVILVGSGFLLATIQGMWRTQRRLLLLAVVVLAIAVAALLLAGLPQNLDELPFITGRE